MTEKPPQSIAHILDADTKDLGEFTVRRTLPGKDKQRVGPFIFWDHMGPAEFPPGAGVSVRPHPHIGLATITYLFEGEIMHRDSLGYVQAITRGGVNWMTAGRGIVHSERSPQAQVESGSPLHGIQAWVALPTDLEETEPRFEHYPAEDIPTVSRPGVHLTIIAGEVYGVSSPVQTSSETVYVEADLDAGASLDTPDGTGELGIYPVDEAIEVDGFRLQPGRMAVLNAASKTTIRATHSCKVMLLGGAKLEGDRILWWNFVSSSRERLNQAKKDWRDGKFGEVPGDSEFIPLPEK
jgi:hypothetical protein